MQSAVKSLSLENKSDVVLHLEALVVKREIISHFGHNFRLQTQLASEPFIIRKNL